MQADTFINREGINRGKHLNLYSHIQFNYWTNMCQLCFFVFFVTCNIWVNRCHPYTEIITFDLLVSGSNARKRCYKQKNRQCGCTTLTNKGQNLWGEAEGCCSWQCDFTCSVFTRFRELSEIILESVGRSDAYCGFYVTWYDMTVKYSIRQNIYAKLVLKQQNDITGLRFVNIHLSDLQRLGVMCH